MGDAPDETGKERKQQRGVDECAWAEYSHGPAVARIFGCVADQPFRICHLVHDDVARVDAGGARNAAHLKSVANVDAGGTDLHAGEAVDAVAKAGRAAFDGLATTAARLAACFVVADDQRVTIEHRALESRVRAHVFADLLAQVAGVAVGRECVEEDPERFPTTHLETRHFACKLVYRREKPDEREARPERKRDPQELLERFPREFRAVPRCGVELHAPVAIAFDLALDPQEHFGPHGLRARVTAPQPSGERGEEKQRQPGHDQQPGQIKEILWPEGQAEDMEFARGKIEQDELMPVPR